MAAFGLLGYLMLTAGFPQPPMLLAMILGPLAESNFRRALSLSRDDFSTFFHQPISCAILAVSACVVLKTILGRIPGDASARRSDPSTLFSGGAFMKRNLSRMFRTGVAAAAALLCAMPFQAAAEDYPSRPITLIMPFGAGNAPRHRRPVLSATTCSASITSRCSLPASPGGSGIPATPRNRPRPSRRLYHQPHLGQRADRRPAIQEVRLHL